MTFANRKPHSLIGFVTIITGLILSILSAAPASAYTSLGLDFEDGSLSGWDIGSQSSDFSGSTITGQPGASGVNIISSVVSYTPPNGVAWTFGPYGTKAALLQPANVAFSDAVSAVGLTPTDETDILALAPGTPYDSAYMSKEVTLNAGTVYTMSWNYIGTDYEPFNDGSLTTLAFTGTGSTPTIKVNNRTGNFALLGFTNIGTGDYSTGSYGSTGWQMSTYEVSETGTYRIGFVVFNMGDDFLDPVLLVDSNPGTTTKNGEDFGAVPPNNSDVPTVPPATEPEPTTEAPPVTDATTTTTVEETTTTAVEETTTTEVEESTTTVPRRPRHHHRPTTTTTTVENTSTLPAVTPTSTPPTDPTLPVTGISTTLAVWGWLCMLGGCTILVIGRLRTNK